MSVARGTSCSTRNSRSSGPWRRATTTTFTKIRTLDLPDWLLQPYEGFRASNAVVTPDGDTLVLTGATGISFVEL